MSGVGNMATSLDKNTRRFLRLTSKIWDDLSHLGELLKLIETALASECAALAERLKAEKGNMSQDESEYLDGWYIIDFQKLQEDFTRLQRYAMFTTAMAAVEANVVALCHVLKENMGLAVKFKKAQSSNVGNALKYLQEQASVDMVCLSEEIEHIDMFRRIRNCIVHSDGKNTDSAPQEIKAYCGSISTLSLNAQDRIVLSESFMSIALDIIRRFFKGLLNSSEKAWKATTIQ
jgi:hypothetical protein